MKELTDALPAERAVETDGFANRKLIRPSLTRNEARMDHNHNSQPAADRRPDRGGDRNNGGDRSNGRKGAPPEQTNAENFYYQKQMQSKTPMVVVLRDGEEIHGIIEWYDKTCLKLTRDDAPNLMIYKPAIKYMFKEAESKG
jgi:sRNA-binding regulator protein Hfq